MPSFIIYYNLTPSNTVMQFHELADDAIDNRKCNYLPGTLINRQLIALINLLMQLINRSLTRNTFLCNACFGVLCQSWNFSTCGSRGGAIMSKRGKLVKYYQKMSFLCLSFRDSSNCYEHLQWV